jgi:structure-specific recognition protein 1
MFIHQRSNASGVMLTCFVQSESKSKKKDVDPDKPKRPQSAYFLWMNENRSKLKEEFPGISVTELTKKAGERWKEVSDKSVSSS